jgi:hypothetical protein
MVTRGDPVDCFSAFMGRVEGVGLPLEKPAKICHEKANKWLHKRVRITSDFRNRTIEADLSQNRHIPVFSQGVGTCFNLLGV